MEMAKKLDESTIQEVADLLTWDDTCKIAAEYLGFHLEELECIWEDTKKTSHDATVEILRQFNNKKTKGKQAWEVSVINFLSICNHNRSISFLSGRSLIQNTRHTNIIP